MFISVFLLLSNTVLAKYFTDDQQLGNDPSIPVVSVYGYLLGGLFVGFGTRMGNGCTTGHGICGMARLSKRSIVAVCTFMVSAFATASVVAPDNQAFASGTAWLRTDKVPVLFNRWLGFGVSMIIVIPSCYALYNLFKSPLNADVHNDDGNCSPCSARCPNQSSLPSRRTEPAIKERTFEASALTTATEQSDTFGVPAVSPSTDINAKGANNNDEGQAAADETSISSQGASEMEGEAADRQDIESGPSNASSSGDVVVTVASPSDRGDNSVNASAYPGGRTSSKDDNVLKLGPSALASALFAVGLAVSEMVLPSKVLGFLNLFTVALGTYDPTLLTVMIGGCVVSMVSYQFVRPYSLVLPTGCFGRGSVQPLDRPLVASRFSVPSNAAVVDAPLIGGALCFGVGWALAGLCPGPAIFLAASGTKPVIACWWPMFLVGSRLAQCLRERGGGRGEGGVNRNVERHQNI